MYVKKRKSTFNLAVGYALMAIGIIGLLWVFGLI